MKLGFDLNKVSVDVNEGVAIVNYEDKDAYISMAKENGIDKETLEKVNEFDSMFIREATNLVAEKAKSTFSHDSSVNLVRGDIGFGLTGNVDVLVNRSVTTKNDNGEEVKRPMIDVVVTSPTYMISEEEMVEMEMELLEAISGEDEE